MVTSRTSPRGLAVLRLLSPGGGTAVSILISHSVPFEECSKENSCEVLNEVLVENVQLCFLCWNSVTQSKRSCSEFVCWNLNLYSKCTIDMINTFMT